MPGLHLFFSKDGLPELAERLPSFHTVCFDLAYESRRHFQDMRLGLYSTSYPSYPINQFEDAEYLIVAEGTIHNTVSSTDEYELRELCQHIFVKGVPDERKVSAWLASHDGSFVIAILDKKSGSWALLNDLLGRLPVYRWRKDGATIISREFSIFVRSRLQLAVDRMAVAQVLLFGFPLLKRTLLAGVERLPAATVTSWNEVRQELSTTILHNSRFDDSVEHWSDKVRNGELDTLVEGFLKGCRRQAQSHSESVLSLSGGLDSRTVAAGLKMSDCDFRAYTFRDAAGHAERDVLRASQVAKALNLQWELIQLPPPTAEDLLHLLKSKPGIITPSQAADIHFMKAIESSCGRSVTLFSGDGGDKVMPSLVPAFTVKSLTELSSLLIERFHVLPLSDISALCGVAERQINDDLESLLDSFPEDSFNLKFLHFMMCQRGMKWAFEGEDRNRAFFWTATPFYSLPFFNAAMRIPSHTKRNHALYCRFLERLSTDAARVPDAARGIPVSSPLFRYRMKAVGFLSRYSKVSNVLRSRLSASHSPSIESPCLRHLESWMTTERHHNGILEKSTLLANLRHPARYSALAVDHIFMLLCFEQFRVHGEEGLRELTSEFR